MLHVVKDITFLERYIGHDCQRLELSWVGHLASVSSSWGTNLPHLLHSEIPISISQSPPGKGPFCVLVCMHFGRLHFFLILCLLLNLQGMIEARPISDVFSNALMMHIPITSPALRLLKMYHTS